MNKLYLRWRHAGFVTRKSLTWAYLCCNSLYCCTAHNNFTLLMWWKHIWWALQINQSKKISLSLVLMRTSLYRSILGVGQIGGWRVAKFEGRRVGNSEESGQSDKEFRSVNTVWPLLPVPLNPKKLTLQKPRKFRDLTMPAVKSVLPLYLVPKRQFSTVFQSKSFFLW